MTTPTTTYGLLDGLRDHLREQGVVRDPWTAGDLPPLWLEPRDGCPAPGEGDAPMAHPTAVLAADLGGGVPPRHGEGSTRQDFVDIHIRVTEAAHAQALEALIRRELAPPDLGVRQAWQMGETHVVESQLWTPLQRTGGDEQAIDYSLVLLLQTYTDPAAAPTPAPDLGTFGP